MGFYHIINAYEDSGHLVLDAPFKVGKIKTFCNLCNSNTGAADIVQRVHGGESGCQAGEVEEVYD